MTAVPDEVEEALKELGEALSEVRSARAAVMRHVARMYSESEARARWGRWISVAEAVSDIQSDLRERRIELRNAREMCTRRGCTDVPMFFDALDRYYKASGKRSSAEYRLTRALMG